MKTSIVLALFLSTVASWVSGTVVAADKPNIVVIWGDDVGYWNVSAYNQGMMGYQTPNIDSVANQGALFTDWYAQQSCTAGRAAFITGQAPIRTGLTKVGLPSAPEGMPEEDPTIAALLKNHGYMTGQFGKNHLGDRDEHLPTNHGFDEFMGNLYHLNAEDEPENVDYPKDPEFKKKFGLGQKSERMSPQEFEKRKQMIIRQLRESAEKDSRKSQVISHKSKGKSKKR